MELIRYSPIRSFDYGKVLRPECYTATVRFFNTTGPVVAADHYCIPPLERLNLDEVRTLIGQKRYFVLHAPRQTGKTSTLLALRDLLNSGAEGEYRCVYTNVEAGQTSREDLGPAIRAILVRLASRARSTLGDRFLEEVWSGVLEQAGPHGALEEVLSLWSEADPRPLVLLIDEIDALVGDTLLSVLRQLRAGYDQRPAGFPQSVVLCGVRDVRDYRIHSNAEKAVIAGGSAFNVKAKSLRLGDFSEEDVRSLLAQHTEETGQAFASDAVATIWRQTRGQPWLVNALAYEACFENEAGRDRVRPVTAAAIVEAQEQLILRQETHLDQLADKLREERVRRVVEPILSGVEAADSIPTDDLQYVRDLGLVCSEGPAVIANPIYREVVPRNLTYTTQEMTFGGHDPAWYVDADGDLRVDGLLAAFQAFFREHSEHWVERFQYKEAGPQLLLQAFLQRVVNSGGRIEREYGLGRMRTDLLIVWPVGGDLRNTRKTVVECKLLHGSLERTVQQGIEQTWAYMTRCAAVEGHLVIFDRTKGTEWEDRIFRRQKAVESGTVTVWGM